MMKRLLAMLMAFSLLLTAGCAGTRKTAETVQEAENTAQPQPQAAESRMMDAEYDEEYYPFPGGYFNGDIARIENKLMILGHSEEKGFLLGLAEFSREENGRIHISPAQHIDMSGYGHVNCLTAGKDGYFYVQTAAEGGYSAEYTILRYDPQGQLVDSMAISGWPMDTYLWDLCVTADSRLILVGDNVLALCPWQGENLELLELGEGILSCTLTDQGLVVNSYMMGGILDLESLSFQAFPEEQLGEVFSYVETQGLDGEYIINNGSKFILYDLDTREKTELLTWNYDLRGSSPGSCVRLTEDSFICAFTNAEKLQVCGVEQVPYVERKPLNVALVGVGDYALGDTRELSRSYEISTSAYEEDLNRFRMDMIAGRCPDLVLFYDMVDTSGEWFEDLYPYLDADPELSRDSFLPNLLPALESGEELHVMWNSAIVNTLQARTADVGDGYGLTPADYTRMVEESPRYQAVFEGFMSDINLLRWVASMSMGTFIDWGAGTCSFESQEFKELLAWCADMGKEMVEGEIYTGPQYERDQILLFLDMVQTIRRIDAWLDVYPEPMTPVGFPNGNEGFSYFELYEGLAMAIPKGSQNKDGAWAFIRNQLSLERQMELGKSTLLPVNIQALQRLMDESVRPEAQEKFYALLDRTHYAKTVNDTALREIILENGEAFLRGDKSLDEAAKLIQSKASIYLAERA